MSTGLHYDFFEIDIIKDRLCSIAYERFYNYSEVNLL